MAKVVERADRATTSKHEGVRTASGSNRIIDQVSQTNAGQPVATARGSDTNEKRFCRTVMNKRPTSNWRVKHARKTSLRSLKSFDVTARESFMLLTDFFASEAWLKKQRRRLF